MLWQICWRKSNKIIHVKSQNDFLIFIVVALDIASEYAWSIVTFVQTQVIENLFCVHIPVPCGMLEAA